MRDAVAEDFRTVPGVEVLILDAVGAADEQVAFAKSAGSADWTIVIAPELDEILAERCRWVRNAGGRHLNPSRAGINLASDKNLLGMTWERSGVRTPATFFSDDRINLSYPMVCKPTHGAGSVHTGLIHDEDELFRFVDEIDAGGGNPHGLVVQEFVPGRPASVAFLVGPSQVVPLRPTFQHISTDGRFRYAGCELPIPAGFADRAVSLGRRAIGCVPGLCGYVGVDLILGDAADGSRDYAIEINPRVSMSYLALRALADFNVAEAMLRLANGGTVPEPRWMPGSVRLREDWTVERG
jgi:tyramine---L-glutamate ligase